MAAPWAQGARVRVIGTMHGQDVVNVWNFATNTVVNDPGQLNDLLLQLAQAMLDCAIQTLLDAVTVDYTLVRVEAQNIYPVLTDPVVATAPAGSVGNMSGTSVSFAASLVNLRTGIDGRKGRGRKFLPPPGEAEISQSAIDNATLLALTNFLTCLAGKFLGVNKTTDWTLGVLSQKDLKAPIGGGFDNAFRIVTQMSPVAALAVMSSRKVGHGD